MSTFPLATLTLTALLGLALVGCDAAEQSAQNLTGKAGEVAKDLARETVSETVNSLNEQIDKAQQASKDWLGKPQEKKEDQQEQTPQAVPAEGVET